MSAAAVPGVPGAESPGGGGGGLALMSCVRETSLEPPYTEPPAADKDTPAPRDTQRNETKKGRFFRGLRRMFRRRGPAGPGATTPCTRTPDDHPVDQSDHVKSRSTGELMADQRTRRKSGQTVYTSGLSVSHDSVFTGEHSASAGSGSGESTDELAITGVVTQRSQDGARGQYMTSGVRAELLDVVRRRGRAGGVDASDDDEDLGLPQSPPASPSTDKGTKRHHAAKSQSSCSDNSLLSVGSSEMEEDSSGAGGIPHTHDGATASSSDAIDGTGEEPPSGVAPLSHSAARHKMAVKPRRTHGAPRRKKSAQVSLSSALPTTPEVNEDGVRNSTSENITITDSYISEKVTTASVRAKHIQYDRTEDTSDGNNFEAMPPETKLKSSSLPPGLALSQIMGQSPIKLSISEQKDSPQSSIKRSKSSAQNKNTKNFEENIEKQSVSEKNLTQYNTDWSDISGKQMNNILRGMDRKFTTAVSSEIQNRFRSVGEEDELLRSSNLECTTRTEAKMIKGEKKSEHDNKYKKMSESEVHIEKKESSKKEESFFSRLLLRKSGKKTKKDTHENEIIQVEHKKNQSRNSTPQHYKQLKCDLNPPPIQQTNYVDHYIRQQKMSCTDHSSHKTIGQKVFSNQVHKRIDKKGGYANDTVIHEANYAKGSITDYGVNDLKHFAEIEKVSSDIPQHSSDHRRSSNENIHRFGPMPYQRLRQRIEPLDIPSSLEEMTKPQLPPKTLDSKNIFPAISHQPKSQSTNLKENISSNVNGALAIQSKLSSDDFTPIPLLPVKQRSNHDLVFQLNNVAIPKHIPIADINDKSLSYSVSPPRSVWPQNYESDLNHKSNSQNSLNPSTPLQFNLKLDLNQVHERSGARQPEVLSVKPKIAGLSSYQQKISQMECELGNDDFASFTDLAEFRNPVSKSQSFRFMSDAVNMNSHQENQMPSLPTMFGYSDSSMESWETNYKRQLREESEKLVERNIENRRKSASNVFSSPDSEFKVKNMNISKESDVDLKDVKPAYRTTLYNKNIIIGSRLESKCDADISQIEANIDNIIGYPKPLLAASLKSTSLDSIKGQSDRIADRNRKALSSECVLNNTGHVNHSYAQTVLPSVTFTQKRNLENTITENFTIGNQKSKEDISFEITDKNNEKIYENVSDFNVTKTHYVKTACKANEVSSGLTAAVPEFLKIQLNKVDAKPATNVVLSTSLNISPNDEKFGTPKKNIDIINTTPKSVKKYRDSLGDIKAATIDRSFRQDKKEYEDYKPHRKFSAEDVEIIEKSSNDVPALQSISVSKSGSQQRLHKSSEYLAYDSDGNSHRTSVDLKNANNILNQNTKNSNLPPLSPTAYKPFYKKRQSSMEIIDIRNDSNRRNSSTALYENIVYDNNSMRSNKEQGELSQRKSEEVNGDGVVYRKKPIIAANQTKGRKDDEPELMKVFARRSLKLKDSEAEALAQEILDSTDLTLSNDSVVRNKNSKGDFNAMIRSRDSDKENEAGSPKDNRKYLLDIENKNRNIADKGKIDNSESLQNQRSSKKSNEIESQSPKKMINNHNIFARNNGFSGYQRSVSISSVSSALMQSNNAKNDSKNDTALYKKEISDSTPEKRMRNRTFPDSSNEGTREDLKVINAANDVLKFKCDTSSLPKRSWNISRADENAMKKIPYRNLSFVTVENKSFPSKPLEIKQNRDSVESSSQSNDNSQSGDCSSTDNENFEGEADGSPQFKGILQMRAEWERRAKQAMTK